MFSKKKRLKAEIEAYRQKLASSDTVEINETIGCHAAMLILTPDTEQRIRSIQTLAQLHAEVAVPAAVKELVLLSHKWPKDYVNGWPVLLLSVLRESSFNINLS